MTWPRHSNICHYNIIKLNALIVYKNLSLSCFLTINSNFSCFIESFLGFFVGLVYFEFVNCPH